MTPGTLGSTTVRARSELTHARLREALRALAYIERASVTSSMGRIEARRRNRRQSQIGPDILCWNSWFWIKEAKSTSYVSWHQDSQYWGLDTTQLVTAWLALSPASEPSGCMRVLPGSHLDTPMSHQDLYDDDNLSTRGQEIIDIDESKSTAMPLTTGEMSLHNIRTAHASGPNGTADRRVGLSFHYMPTRTRQRKTDWDCASLVRGEDRYGHFDPSPVPSCDFDPVIVAYHAKATTAMRELLFQGAKKVRLTV